MLFSECDRPHGLLFQMWVLSNTMRRSQQVHIFLHVKWEPHQETRSLETSSAPSLGDPWVWTLQCGFRLWPPMRFQGGGGGQVRGERQAAASHHLTGVTSHISNFSMLGCTASFFSASPPALLLWRISLIRSLTLKRPTFAIPMARPQSTASFCSHRVASSRSIWAVEGVKARIQNREVAQSHPCLGH